MERPSLPENLSPSRRHAVKELLRGQESAKHLLTALSRGTGGGAEDLVVEVLRSFDNTLSLLNRADPDEVSEVPVKACRVKSEDSEESSKTSFPRDRRGCYKRRKTLDTRMREDPNLIDDGHQWRKYGQKAILNSEFPRSYFRCTHKNDQRCQATKQVQKTKDDPPVYRTTYQGHHTCRNLVLKLPPLLLESPSPRDSSILLSFNPTPTPKKDGNGNGNGNSNPFSSPTFLQVKHEQKLCGGGGCGDGRDNSSNNNNNNHQSESSDYYAVFESAGEISALSSDQGDVMSSCHGFDMIGGSDFDDLLDIGQC